ncbi:MAG: hypothetical protein GY811_22015 [Myxococcales bacterium]|nr:hypothetical protein [Myxococcales bacterium]
MERARIAAAKRGANAIVMMKKNAAFLIRLSDATEVNLSAEALLSRVSSVLRPDFKKLKSTTTSLAAPKALTFQAKSSHCYVLAFALDESAEYGEAGKGGFRISVEGTGLKRSIEVRTRKKFGAARSGHKWILCSGKSRRVSARIVPWATDSVEPLGLGSISLALYAKPISAKERDLACGRCRVPEGGHNEQCMNRFRLEPRICE